MYVIFRFIPAVLCLILAVGQSECVYAGGRLDFIDDEWRDTLLVRLPSEPIGLRAQIETDASGYVLAWNRTDSLNFAGVRVKRLSGGLDDEIMKPQWGADFFVMKDGKYTEMGRQTFSFDGDRCAIRLTMDEASTAIRVGRTSKLRVPDVINEGPLPESEIFCMLPADAGITVQSLQVEEAVEAPLADFKDLEELTAYLKESTDSVEGLWRLFDMNCAHPETTQVEGNYVLATVRAADGYNIIYIDGGDVARRYWRPLQRRGRLIPTGFIGNYDLEWVDAGRRQRLTTGNYAELGNGNSLLSLRFPLYSSEIRLVRVRLY